MPGVTPAAAASAVAAFLAAASVEVERLTSKGLRRMDARAAVVTLEADRRGTDAAGAGNVRYFEWSSGIPPLPSGPMTS